jgi:hypothetical protein
MRRTSTLPAAGAVLGMLAGFAMTPADRAPLERELTPHAVAVAWRGPVPPELPVAGVQVDDWGGRLAPAPERPTKLAPMRAQPPRGRPAPTQRAVPGPSHKAYRAPHPLVLRQRDLATFTRPAVKQPCPRHGGHTAPAHES